MFSYSGHYPKSEKKWAVFPHNTTSFWINSALIGRNIFFKASTTTDKVLTIDQIWKSMIINYSINHLFGFMSTKIWIFIIMNWIIFYIDNYHLFGEKIIFSDLFQSENKLERLNFSWFVSIFFIFSKVSFLNYRRKNIGPDLL